MSVNEKMTAIADNIRDKTGGTEALTLDDMASGVNEVYEAGKKAEYLDWWAKYLAVGSYLNQANYLFGGTRWNDNTFYPPYDIVLAGVNSSVFMYNGCTNIRQRLIDMGVKIKGWQNNTGWGITNVNRFFYGSSTTEIPDMENACINNMSEMCRQCKKLVLFPSTYDTSMVTTFSSTFYDCLSLERIEKIDFSSATSTTSTFVNCTKLSDITVEGTIPISLSFSSSPLSIASLKSIITHLKDYSGTTSQFTYTVTFSSACITALEAEGHTSPNGNSWVGYIADLGWNLG